MELIRVDQTSEARSFVQLPQFFCSLPSRFLLFFSLLGGGGGGEDHFSGKQSDSFFRPAQLNGSCRSQGLVPHLSGESWSWRLRLLVPRFGSQSLMASQGDLPCLCGLPFCLSVLSGMFSCKPLEGRGNVCDEACIGCHIYIYIYILMCRRRTRGLFKLHTQ